MDDLIQDPNDGFMTDEQFEKYKKNQELAKQRVAELAKAQDKVKEIKKQVTELEINFDTIMADFVKVL